MPFTRGYRNDYRQVFSKAEIGKQHYLRFVNDGGLRLVRELIRSCIEYERLILEQTYDEKKPPIFHHIRQEIRSTKVQNLLLETNLVKSFLRNNCKERSLVYPLSSKWIEIFEKSGVKVNRILCFMLFRTYSVKHFFVRYLKVISRRNMMVISFNQVESARALLHIQPELVRDHTDHTELMDFIAWLKRQDFLSCDSRIDFLLNNTTCSKEIFTIGNLFMNFRVVPFVREIFKLFLKNPINFSSSMLIAPNLIINYCRLNEKILNRVNLIVIPSAMGWIKSTWHLKAEEIGIKVIFVNLSNSGEPAMTFDNKYPVTWAPLSNWRNMTICSEFQRACFSEFIKRSGSCHLELVSVPDWTDIERDVLINETNYISIFDIEPHVGHYGFSSINDSGYSNISNTILFIEDISRIAAELRIKFLLKPKRNVSGIKRYKEYEIALKNLSKSNKYFSIANESVAPRRIIGSSMATIHMPFTSTALIGKELNKPTCFYDPVGLINLNDPSASDIKIIKKPEELKIWLQNLVGIIKFQHDQ